MFAATTYMPLPRQLVSKLKFDRARAAAEAMARLCSPLVPPESTIITYVPTANSRVRMRGYDQSRLIARRVAQYRDTPMLPLLARTTDVRQVGADAKERRLQMANAFRPRNLSVIKGAHVTLIDDVLTTGSTAQAAARVLLAAGAARVDFVVFSVA